MAREVDSGVWFCAAASPSVALTEAKEADGYDLWHSVLNTMGGA